MLAIISPAKTLDFGPLPYPVEATVPTFAEDAAKLAKSAKRLSRRKLGEMMDISPKLADLTYQRFQQFDPDPDPRGAKPAIHAFKGDTYIGLDAGSISPEDLTYAQEHVRILSGLYGLLRPLDRIQPYRLEMHVGLKTRRGKDLYAAWGERLAEKLNETETDVIVNLASAEYWKAARADLLKADVITPNFLEVKDGVAKAQSFALKRARGMLTRFIVENRISNPDDLKNFSETGYTFMPDLSTPERPVFHREQQ
ncbi:MAG: peroxide stress protein YaaA [Alphaproteobacteria bacterium]